uniref:Uncharacterized protein n=1 Tax=Globodera rostochiensis TaxID=31243 RepID=A0A914HP34_GLORO
MSILTESTNVTDITAEPECWPLNLASLAPSEEMQLLRARIAQLERQQTTNSSTTNASFNLLTSRRCLHWTGAKTNAIGRSGWMERRHLCIRNRLRRRFGNTPNHLHKKWTPFGNYRLVCRFCRRIVPMRFVVLLWQN